MSNATNAPFDYNLQSVASIAATRLSAFDVSRIVPVEVVDPTDDHGLIRVDRTDLAVDDSQFEAVRGEFDESYAIEAADGSDVSYRCMEIRLPPHTVPRKRNQRRQVKPGLLDKAAAAQIKMLASRLYRMGVGLYTAANFPSRTAAFTSLEPGGLQANAAGANIIHALKSGREASMDGNGQHKPNLCIIGEKFARAVGKNSDVLAKLPTIIGSHGLPKASVIDLLEQHLEMRVEVSDADVNGTFLWDSDIVAFTYLGDRTPAPRPASIPAGGLPDFVFPGTVRMAEKDTDGYLDNELTTAALIMSRFPDIEDAIGDGNPIAWGVSTIEEARRYLVGISAFVSRKLIDPLSGYIISNSMA